MRRLYRLLTPGITLAVLGGVLLLVADQPWAALRGGLVVTGLYALALQAAASAVIVSAIDDSPGHGGALAVRGQRNGRSLLSVAARPLAFPRALVLFHQLPVIPMALVAFGVGASLSCAVVGAFGLAQQDENLSLYRSEAVLALVAVVVGGALWRWGAGSFYGWMLGFTAAVVLGQLALVPDTDVALTVQGWSAFAVTSCALGATARAVSRRRAAPVVGAAPR